MEERQRRVPADLVNAMQAVLGGIPERPSAVVLLSMYLFDVAKDYGLSGHGRSSDQLSSITLNHPAKGLIEALLSEKSDGSCTEDDLTDLLHPALLAVSNDVSARQKLHTKPTPNETDTRMFGQVYWNLFPVPARENLPIPSNTSAPGPTRSDSGTYETMTWNQRMEAGVELHKGPIVRRGTIRRRGDRLAVLLAKYLADTHENLEKAAIEAAFRFSENGKTVSIRWQEPTTADGRTAQFENRKPDEVDALRSLAETGVSNGNHADAADMLELAVKILRRRSEEEIGDHEFRLALVSMEAGQASTAAGRLDEAIEHFLNVEKGALILSALSPHSTTLGLVLAVALIGQGALYVPLERFDQAEEVLRRAVVTSQGLADQDPDAEVILALSLCVLGSAYLTTDRPTEGTSSLVRAETIIRKLDRHVPTDPSIQAVLAWTLVALGEVLLFSEQEREGTMKLTEALRISTTLSEDHQFHNDGLLLHATAVCALVFADLTRVLAQDDDHAAARQIRVIDEQLAGEILILEDLPNDHRASTLVSAIAAIRKSLLEISVELEND